jgi:hypothetical protein
MFNRMKFVLVLAAVVLIGGVATVGGTAAWLKGRVRTTDYCAGCHVIAPYYDTWKSSLFTAHAHAAVGIVCQDCHQRTVRDGLREIVSNVSRESPSGDYRVSPKICLGCHVSYRHLAGLTGNLRGPDGFALGRNPHHSHWGSLDCGICHKMHKPSVDLCSKCHGFPIKAPAWTGASQPTRTPESTRDIGSPAV